MDPMGYAREIYEFIGEDFHADIEKMLQEAVAPPKMKLDKSKATYTTNRAVNSTQVGFRRKKSEIRLSFSESNFKIVR